MTSTTVEPGEFDVAFIAGFGQWLENMNVGVWSPVTGFGTTDIAVTAGGLPASPASAIALMSYDVEDASENADSTVALQVTTRADGTDPRGTDRLAAKVYNELQGLSGVMLPGGVYVVQCLLQSWTSTGQDDNSRWRKVQNFYVDVHRPSKYRI